MARAECGRACRRTAQYGRYLLPLLLVLLLLSFVVVSRYSTSTRRTACSPSATPAAAASARLSLPPDLVDSHLCRRVAVCVSGQPRSLNTPLPSHFSPMLVPSASQPDLLLPHHPYGKQWTVNATTADNIQSMLFDELAVCGFDVFMFVSTTEDHPRLPRVGDTSVCEPLRPRQPGNNSLLCEVVKEVQVAGQQRDIMRSYFYEESALQQSVLQQLDGLKQCHRMQRQYSERTGTQYSHMVRLRPDNIFFEPIPPLANLSFVTSQGNRTLYTGSKQYCCCGNEDWFGIGRMSYMSRYFDRYDALIGSYAACQLGMEWTAEDFLVDYMREYADGTTVTTDDPRIHACVHKYNESGHARP